MIIISTRIIIIIMKQDLSERFQIPLLVESLLLIGSVGRSKIPQSIQPVELSLFRFLRIQDAICQRLVHLIGQQE